MEALSEIAKDTEGVAVADIGGVHRYMQERKRFIDMTSNNVNHPNDFFYRVHAQFLAGMLIILVLFSQAAAFNAPVLVDVMDGAEHLTEGGLEVGDRFYRIDGHRIYFSGDISLFLDRAGDVVDLEVQRGDEIIVLDDFDFARKVPYVTESGETVYMRGITFGAGEEATFGLVLKNTWYQTVNCVRMVWMSLGDLFTGAVGLREVSGVIGIVDAVGDVGASAESAADGLMSVFNLMSLIAINLAVMNLLPIPALDGGRIFFLIVGGLFRLIFRKELNPKYENWVNTVCFVLLMGLMILIAVSDVLKLAGV